MIKNCGRIVLTIGNTGSWPICFRLPSEFRVALLAAALASVFDPIFHFGGAGIIIPRFRVPCVSISKEFKRS